MEHADQYNIKILEFDYSQDSYLQAYSMLNVSNDFDMKFAFSLIIK